MYWVGLAVSCLLEFISYDKKWDKSWKIKNQIQLKNSIFFLPEDAMSPLSDNWGEEGEEMLILEDARFLIIVSRESALDIFDILFFILSACLGLAGWEPRLRPVRGLREILL